MPEIITDIRRLRKRFVAVPEDDPLVMPTDPIQSRLWQLAAQVIQGEDMYTREEIIARIQQHTSVTPERATQGFIMMIEAQAIRPTLNPSLFYLGTSTPF